MATAIFYASSTGNTKEVAERLAQNLDGVATFDIGTNGVGEMASYDKLILGSSTWGEGELQDDWLEYWEDFCELDFSGKTVALFGLGDQEGYEDNFLDAMGMIHEQVVQAGGTVVGHWPAEGYGFEDSKALSGDEFVGLALDEDNQDELTEKRLKTWSAAIKEFIC